MKKLFAIFAIAGLMATASCGNKEVTEETTETMESTEEVVEETIEVVEETADSSAVMVEEVVEEVK
ncbi:MAG: methyl-accepting chemotaxis protein [Algoriphagus sp.]|jgi:methyl-accepting chemotaxis protein|tara:strand:- start:636 stop:833 length:198 start_codon:yes stop_codon:yes gene_type:complete